MCMHPSIRTGDWEWTWSFWSGWRQIHFRRRRSIQETEYAKKAYRDFRGSYAQKRYHQSMYLCHRAQRGNPSFDGYAGGSRVKYDGRQGEYGQELSGLPAGRVGGVSAAETVEWIKDVLHKKYKHTRPILTPRFTPSCTDALMERLKMMQMRYELPVQSHLSENPGEISWVKELCPWSEFYGDAYDRFGLFGSDCPTIMAHCVYSDEKEIARMKENGVYIAHCPESNMNCLPVSLR